MKVNFFYKINLYKSNIVSKKIISLHLIFISFSKLCYLMIINDLKIKIKLNNPR